MTTDVAVPDPQSGTLALTGDQTDWTPVQAAALAHLGIAEAPRADQQVFLHVAQKTGLDPFARQIHMIGRNETQPDGSKRKKWTIQTGIDGFRLIAERHPQYRGQIGPQWCGEDGVWQDVWLHPTKPPVAARVGVLRGDRDEPIWGTALFREYAQTKTWDGRTELTKMWREKGTLMVAKCAEALAVRKAFPLELGSVYADEELGGRGAHGGDATPAGRQAVTTAELTGAPTVVDVDPEPAKHEPSATEPTAPAEQASADTPPRRPAAATQKKKIAILTGEAGLDDAGRYEIAGALAGKVITSTDELSMREAAAVIQGLEQLQATDDFATAVATYLHAYREQVGPDSTGAES